MLQGRSKCGGMIERGRRGSDQSENDLGLLRLDPFWTIPPYSHWSIKYFLNTNTTPLALVHDIFRLVEVNQVHFKEIMGERDFTKLLEISITYPRESLS